jgi:hypothetical protein
VLNMNIEDETIYHNLNKFQNYYSWGKKMVEGKAKNQQISCVFLGSNDIIIQR